VAAAAPASGGSEATAPEELETEEAKKLVEKMTAESAGAARDEESTKEVVSIAARAVGSLSDTDFDVAFNPDVFQEHVKHAEPEVRAERVGVIWLLT